MRAPLLMLSLGLAMAVAPTASQAQPATQDQSTGQMPATMATYVCRPATSQDQMTNAGAMSAAHAESATLGGQKVVCMKLDRDSMVSQSAKAKAMSSAGDADSSWMNYLQTHLNIPTITLVR